MTDDEVACRSNQAQWREGLAVSEYSDGRKYMHYSHGYGRVRTLVQYHESKEGSHVSCLPEASGVALRLPACLAPVFGTKVPVAPSHRLLLTPD